MCYRPPTSYLELNNGQTVYDANSFTYNAMSSMPGIGSAVYDAAGGSYTVVDADTTGMGPAIPAIEYPVGNTPPSYIPLNITAGTPAMPSVGASGFLPHTKNYQVLGTVGTGGSAAVTAGTTSITISDQYPAKIYTYDTLPNGKMIGTYTGSLQSHDKKAYQLDFSRYGNLPDDLHEQGFSVLCDGCRQFVSVMFDKDKSFGSGEYYMGTDGVSECYIVGVQGAATSSDIVQALADGINNARGIAAGTNPATISTTHNVQLNIYIDAGGTTKCYLEKSDLGLCVYNGIKGKLNVIPDQHIYTSYMTPTSSIYIQGDTAASANTALKLPNTTLGMLFPGTDDHWVGIEPTEADYPEPWPNEYDGLTDDEKKQKFRSEVWPYPEVTDIELETCISTQSKARAFLTNIDQALRYLENSITTMGAQHQRLAVMNDNIVIVHENTTAADSTIRDANMAKEMTAYAKYNILSQSSQAMLAQANQSSSNVLNLLQS
ncbi:MAG: flagellin [Anaerovibrio sp.]